MKSQRNHYRSRKGEQNIFRTITAGRQNFLLEFILGFLFTLSAYPSHIVEVFMRKKFGERYFTTFTAIVISIVLTFIYLRAGSSGRSFLGFTWPVFTILFLVKSIQHRLEITKFGTAYNFDRFSFSDGETHNFLTDLIGTEIVNIKITRYRFHVIIEPGIPILIGLLLALIPFTRGIGLLIFISGICFGIRNFMKSHFARQIVLDIIDDIIANDGKRDILVEEKPQSETKGLSFPIDLPENIEIREELARRAVPQEEEEIWEYDLDDKGKGSA